MTTRNEKQDYKAPVAKVIEFSSESLICQSPGDGNTDMNDGGEI